MCGMEGQPPESRGDFLGIKPAWCDRLVATFDGDARTVAFAPVVCGLADGDGGGTDVELEPIPRMAHRPLRAYQNVESAVGIQGQVIYVECAHRWAEIVHRA